MVTFPKCVGEIKGKQRQALLNTRLTFLINQGHTVLEHLWKVNLITNTACQEASLENYQYVG